MVASRDQVISQLNEYINSFTAENSYLGGSNESVLLQNLHNNYQKLSKDDQLHIQDHWQRKFDTSFTPEQKNLLNNLSRNIVTGAVLGAVSGAIGGAIVGNCASQAIAYTPSFFQTALKYGGSLVGSGLCAFGGAFFKVQSHVSSTNEIMDLTRKLRPFKQSRNVFSTNKFGQDFRRAMYENTEDYVKKLDALPRQRR